VAEWYGAESRVGCCVPTPTQRTIPPGSINEYQRKRGVNGHTTRCTSPVSVFLRLRLVSGWGLWKRRSAPPYFPL